MTEHIQNSGTLAALISKTCLLWWIVADKIDSFGPNLSPYIHVVTQVDGTANPTTGGPNQLQKGDKAKKVKVMMRSYIRGRGLKNPDQRV